MNFKKLLIAVLFTGWSLVVFAQAADKNATEGGNCPATLDFKFPRLQDEKMQDLCQYKGKVVLVVNTASYCGFTSQYEGLESIYSKYASKGLVVIGFPSNDFGQQEPGSNKEIADFCKNTYGVKFPMMAKTVVSGSNANPMFKLLIEKTKTTPKWNFYKYLIDREGNVVNAYSSMVKPDSKTITSEIDKLLVGKK